LVSPARRRAAVAHLIRRFGVSQRRACAVTGQHRSTQRYVPVPGDFEDRLVKEMVRLSEAHPRYGYRRVHALLVSGGWAVNVKRVERLWAREGLRVPPRRKDHGQKAIGDDANSAWARPATRPMHVWAYDFVAARTIDGAPLRILNVIDEFSKVAPGSLVARSIGSSDVVTHLTALFEVHGKPVMIRSDNGREFISSTVRDFLADQGVEAVFVAKASPQQNCFIERFNWGMRDELLNGESFRTLTEARVVVEAYIEQHNHDRPHQALGNRTPAAFAAYHASHGDGAHEGGE
jgi:transposase InsO family protein